MTIIYLTAMESLFNNMFFMSIFLKIYKNVLHFKYQFLVNIKSSPAYWYNERLVYKNKYKTSQMS